MRGPWNKKDLDVNSSNKTVLYHGICQRILLLLEISQMQLLRHLHRPPQLHPFRIESWKGEELHFISFIDIVMFSKRENLKICFQPHRWRSFYLFMIMQIGVLSYGKRNFKTYNCQIDSGSVHSFKNGGENTFLAFDPSLSLSC